ncbi:DUF1002 domain-containing protein [Aerococcaceae bacterium DSM 111176]|nr:DUF1002 domain-containing protein [Aerococcaceae bacterium DSM 111176]
MKALRQIVLFTMALILMLVTLNIDLGINLVVSANDNVLTENQSVVRPAAAVGTSLTAQEYNRTLQLLTADDLAIDDIMLVDGAVLDQYLNYGADANTIVISSAAIFPNENGLEIEIITPTNIQSISQTTYHNAALTAGANNMTIKIAAVKPVTGEGALAAVYALLEKVGYQLDENDIGVAEDEIQIIIWLQENFGLTEEQANAFIRELKRLVSERLQNQETINEDEIREIVLDVCSQFNIDPTEDQLLYIINFAIAYSGTRFANSEDATDTLKLHNEIDFEGEWIHLIPPMSNWTHQDLLNLENPEVYRDETMYHPIIPAMFDRYFSVVKEDNAMGMPHILGHTFIVEAMQPDFSQAEGAALNRLRTYIYYHSMYREPERQSYAINGSVTPVIDDWTAQTISMEDMLINDPHSFDLNQRMGNATGMAYQSYADGVVGPITGNSSNNADYQVTYRNPLGAVSVSHIADYHMDSHNNRFYEFDMLSNQETEIPANYDFTVDYGVAVENNYQSPVTGENDINNPEGPVEDGEPSIADLQSIDYSVNYDSNNHPIIGAFYQRFAEIINGIGHYEDYHYNISQLISHTYLFEAMQGGVSDQDSQALGTLREYIMTANDLLEGDRVALLSERNMTNYPNTFNQYWQEQINIFENLIVNQANVATEQQQIAIYSGLDPHIFAYQVGEVSDYLVMELGLAYYGDIFRSFNYYPETGQVERLGIMPGNNQILSQPFDFEGQYGVRVDNNFSGYGSETPVEDFSSEEDTQSNTSQTEQPVIEEPSQPVPSNVAINLNELYDNTLWGYRENIWVPVIIENNGEINFPKDDNIHGNYDEDTVYLYEIYNNDEKVISVSRGDGTEIVDQVPVVTTIIPTQLLQGNLDHYLNEEMYLYYNYNGELAIAIKDYEGIYGDENLYLEYILETSNL